MHGEELPNGPRAWAKVVGAGIGIAGAAQGVAEWGTAVAVDGNRVGGAGGRVHDPNAADDRAPDWA